MIGPVWKRLSGRMRAPRVQPSDTRLRAVRDLSAAMLGVLLIGGGIVWFDISERFLEFASRHEVWQLDELPLLMLTTSAFLAWLAGRRWADADAELVARIQAEQRVRELLQDNQRLLIHALEAQEEERGNLARELHDELGQYLHAARAEAVALRFSLEGKAQVERVEAIETSLTHIAMATREQIGRLRPPALDELGLSSAIEYLLERQCASSADLNWKAQLSPELDRLSAVVAIQVYRIVQESLNNVVKHAGATLVQVTAIAQDDAIALTVQDNGRGFTSHRHGGYGLSGMRERAESFHGEISIESRDGQGVKVTIRIPHPEEKLA